MTLIGAAQTVSALYLMFVYSSSGFCGFYVLYYFLWSKYWFLSVAYVWWVTYDNLYTPKESPIRSNWFRNWPMWRWACEYFPINIHVTFRYDPKKTYICGYHPHGVMPTGAVLGLSSNGIGVDEKLPGITASLCSLGLIHWLPIYREVSLLLGILKVDRATIRAMLSTPGNMLFIVVGGAAESLEGENGKYALIVKRRKGFIREAIIAGSCLVPTFSFGENYNLPIVKTVSGSFGRKVQNLCKLYTGVTLPLIKGRSFFGIPIPVFPHRKPIDIVFGEPIDVRQNSNPTTEEIDTLHEKYLNKLRLLFETSKAQFEPNATLQFI